MTLVSPLDAPALVVVGVVTGVAYRRWLCRHNQDWFVVLGALSVGAFWLSLLVAVGTGLPPWGVAPVVDTGSLVLAVFYPLAYPFWFLTGGWAVFLMFGRRPDQGGVYWLYRIEDRTEEFDRPWES